MTLARRELLRFAALCAAPAILQAAPTTDLRIDELEIGFEDGAGVSEGTGIPKLCVLVTASPLDAAFHDAFGKLHGRNSFSACGREFVRHDLSHDLNGEFRSEYLDRYVAREPVRRVRMYHSVGASDPLSAADVHAPIGDGLPETLEDWIPYSGVTAIKIKLNGADFGWWEVDRVAAIDSVTTRAQVKRGFGDWVYSLDFNESCPNAEHVLEFPQPARGGRSATPGIFNVRDGYLDASGLNGPGLGTS